MLESSTPLPENEFPVWIFVIIAFAVILSIVGVILALAYCKHKREKAEIVAEKKAAEKRRRSHTLSERQISRASERNVRQVAVVPSKSKKEIKVPPSSEVVQQPSSSVVQPSSMDQSRS